MIALAVSLLAPRLGAMGARLAVWGAILVALGLLAGGLYLRVEASGYRRAQIEMLEARSRQDDQAAADRDRIRDLSDCDRLRMLGLPANCR